MPSLNRFEWKLLNWVEYEVLNSSQPIKYHNYYRFDKTYTVQRFEFDFALFNTTQFMLSTFLLALNRTSICWRAVDATDHRNSSTFRLWKVPNFLKSTKFFGKPLECDVVKNLFQKAMCERRKMKCNKEQGKMKWNYLQKYQVPGTFVRQFKR